MSIGARVTYFGKLTLTGFGYNGDGINPEVPTDADENVFYQNTLTMVANSQQIFIAIFN